MEQTKFSDAIDGYLLHARARRLSDDTIRSYLYGLRGFQRHLDGDPDLRDITARHVRSYLASLDGLRPKTVRIHYHALAALWTWAVAEGLAPVHVPHQVGAPHAPEREILPFSKDELLALLRACDRTAGYSRPGKRLTDNARPTALRDRAILLLLVDTGIRASELVGLTRATCDLQNHRIVVTGKGQRERQVPISPRTEQALWRYLKTRQDLIASSPLFQTGPGQPLTRDILRRLLSRLGHRAGVHSVNVHRFRHTFAIQALRNGMNVFALQRCLGHATLDMCRRYLAISQTDIAAAHRDASPVMNWLL